MSDKMSGLIQIHLKKFGPVLARVVESPQPRVEFLSGHAQAEFEKLPAEMQLRLVPQLGRLPLILEGAFLGHPLAEYVREVQRDYFDFQIPVQWGRSNNATQTRSITFGWYHPKPPRVVINQRLNQSWVPDYFIKHVIHHELLHHVCPGHWDRNKAMGRYWRVHTAEFREREKQFQGYHQARLFLKQNLHRFVYCADEGIRVVT